MFKALESRFNAQSTTLNLDPHDHAQARNSPRGHTVLTLVTLCTDLAANVTPSGAGPRHAVLEVLIVNGESADSVESDLTDSHTRRCSSKGD